MLAAFLDALTVTAVLISVGVGFYGVYHKIHSSDLDLDADGVFDRTQLSGEKLGWDFIAFFKQMDVITIPVFFAGLLLTSSLAPFHHLPYGKMVKMAFP